ncbi:hypothetical protein V6N13_090631 [Hibiscus sabdariffa]|uniref:Uncharacterized protein n=2 Tax=Hibiscus sabdariffa TaxID=183260 RepID=A0ABR2ABD4_9ROSI
MDRGTGGYGCLVEPRVCSLAARKCRYYRRFKRSRQSASTDSSVRSQRQRNNIQGSEIELNEELDNPIDIFSHVHRPVILPLSRARSSRCSVKPASRCAFHSKIQEIIAFAKIPWPNSELGMGRKDSCRKDPITWDDPMFHSLNAPTCVTSLRYQARQANLMLTLHLSNTY